jgi:hypothetical protein
MLDGEDALQLTGDLCLGKGVLCSEEVKHGTAKFLTALVRQLRRLALLGDRILDAVDRDVALLAPLASFWRPRQ